MRRKPTTTVHLTKEVATFLEERGAVADSTGGPRNRSAALRRTIERFDAALRHTDPREAGFPDSYVAVLASLIDDPWTLDADDIELMDVRVARSPNLQRACAASKVDPEQLVQALHKLNFVERLCLIDLLEQKKGQPSPKKTTRR